LRLNNVRVDKRPNNLRVDRRVNQRLDNVGYVWMNVWINVWL